MSDSCECHQPHVDILIGHAVPLYQEVLAATFRLKRPHLVVHLASPDELDSLVCRLQPALVICSSATDALERCATSWAVLYPDERDEVIFSTQQSSRTIPHATIATLIDLIDLNLSQ